MNPTILLAAALALSCLGNALLFGWWQDAKTATTQCQATDNVATDVNAGQADTIDALQRRLMACEGREEAVAEVADGIDARFEARFTKFEQEMARERAAREKVYAVAQCAALRALPVCRELDQRVWPEAGGGEDRNR